MANNNQQVYFGGEKSSIDIIIEILEKNELKETLSDFMLKRKEGKPSRIKILFLLARDFAEQKITEKEFIESIQKQLETTPENAQNICADIRVKLFPFIERASDVPQNTIPVNTEEKNQITTPPQLTNIPPVKKNPITNEVIKPKLKTTKSAPKSPEVKPEIKKIVRSGPDRYREPIE